MTATHSILLLAALAGTLTASAQTAQPRRPAADSQRTNFFTGNGSVSWLPKTSLLPTAGDVEALARKLSSRQRNMDPFGLSTFPREGEEPAGERESSRPTERITLNQALQTLRVSGVNLAKKEILIGGRNVFEGDVAVLSFKNEVFLAQVTEVSATQVLFRDLKRKETGVLQHSLLPHLELETMQSRSGKDALQGMVSPVEKPDRPQR